MKFLSKILILSLLLPGIFISCTEEDKEKMDKYPAGNVIRSIYIDKLNRIWFATENGVSLYNGKGWRNFDLSKELAGAKVFELANNSFNPELISAGTLNGMLPVTATANPTFGTVVHLNNPAEGIDSILYISTDGNQFLWFGNKSLLGCLKNNSAYTLPVSIQNEFEKYSISDVGSDAEGWNYFATQGHGVARIKSSLDGVSGESILEQPWSGIPSMEVNCVLVLENGDQWYGTNGGAGFHEGRNARSGWQAYYKTDGLTSDTVLCIHKDGSGKIWFGTDKGVSSLFNNVWQQYTSIDGLASDTVYAIQSQQSGDIIWFGTANGISRYDGSWKTFRAIE